MRRALFAMLILTCTALTGCESMKRMSRWPGKTPTKSPDQEQLALDSQRRQAAEQQAAISPSNSLLARQTQNGKQQANFPPAIPAGGGNSDQLLLQASQAERAGQNTVAYQLYEEVLKSQPQHPQAHHRLGVLNDQQERYSEAQQHYQMALSQEPNNSVLLSDIGFSLYSQDRLDEAEQYLQAALRAQPDNAVAHNNLAQVYGRRAEQTGSQSDYQLAREQLAMANGPDGADEQMKQMFPNANPNQASKGFPNPFKKLINRDKNQVAQAGSDLQAPDPDLNKPTRKFIETFEELKQEAVKKGEYTTTTGRGSRGGGRGAPAPRNVTPDQINNELTKIDQEAQIRRDLALRELNPYKKSPNRQPEPQWEQDEIMPAGAWDDQGSGGPQNYPDRNNPSINPSRPRRPGSFQGPPGGQRGPDVNGGSFNGTPQDSRNLSLSEMPQVTDPSTSQDWMQQGGSGMSRSWPAQDGSPTQYDAGGERWDGNSAMQQERVAPGTEQFGSGFESNRPYQPHVNGGGFNGGRTNEVDPRYSQNRISPDEAAGGNQVRPISSTRGGLIPAPAGWGRGQTTDASQNAEGQYGAGQFEDSAYQGDDGRRTAAQLALDAGMGEMFPGNAAEQPTMNARRQGRAPYGPRNSRPTTGGAGQQRKGNSGWDAIDPNNQSLQAHPTTQNGMAPGGAGMMSPTDYAPQQSSYQNGGYPQGATPMRHEYLGEGNPQDAWGDSQYNSGNGSGTSGRNVIRSDRPVYRDNGYHHNVNQGGSNQRGQSPQNFGAPGMYFGR